MNAPWYSWGYGHVRPSVFVAAWRHIVTLFRSEGADNVTWLWTLNQDRPGTGPVAAWWPGASYVTWVGIDGYYFRPSDTFASGLRPHHRPGADLHRQAGAAVRDRGGARVPASSPRSATCSTGCAGTGRSGWSGSTRPSSGGLYHQDWRIEDSQPARRPSGWASRR